MHLTDDQILFLLALGAILIVLGLATLVEHGLLWLLRRWRKAAQLSDASEEHAERPNPL
jgi:hypothetical protein